MTESWIELPAMTDDDLAVPPTLHAVPANTQPVLEPYTRVTYGTPHLMWMVDAGQITSGPYRADDGEEYYHVAPWSEYGAAPIREETLHGASAVRATKIPTDDLWVYRPSPVRRTLDEVCPPGIADWMDRMVPDVLVPPPVRAARPARELPSLTGRDLVSPNRSTDTGWVAAVAVSEAFEQDGIVCVRVVRPEHYHLAVYRADSFASDMVKTVGLHRLWAY